MPYFADEATIFLPPAARGPVERIQGRTGIEQAFRLIFNNNPRPADVAPRPIAPQDLLIQQFEGWSVVTFHLGRGPALQRRTLVLKQVGREWKIVHLHASAAGGQP
jgi:hypothetical protein